MRRRDVIFVAGLVLAFCAFAIAKHLQPTAHEIAQVYGVSRGLPAEQLLFVGRRSQTTIFEETETVDFLVGFSRPSRKVRIFLQRPLWSLQWHAVDMQELPPSCRRDP